MKNTFRDVVKKTISNHFFVVEENQHLFEIMYWGFKRKNYTATVLQVVNILTLFVLDQHSYSAQWQNTPSAL